MERTKDILKNEIMRLEQNLEEYKNLMNRESDKDMKSLLSEEIIVLEKQMEELNKSLESLEAPQYEEETKTIGDEVNPNKAILEIRAGTGGDEAGLFAYDLYRMYTRYSEKHNWKVEVLNLSLNERGGIKSAIVVMKGKDVYSLLKNESGVHRVQRVPVTETGGRTHTSTATVAVLPEVSQINIEIRPEDVKMDFYRSGGAGGQNVNKVSTAVRLTHLPTGVVVECQEERSQLKNRERAMNVLKSRIYNMMQEQQVKSISDLRAGQVGMAERSEKIRTYNFPQNRITDHRLGKNWHNIEAAMNGEIEDILTDTSALSG